MSTSHVTSTQDLILSDADGASARYTNTIEMDVHGDGNVNQSVDASYVFAAMAKALLTIKAPTHECVNEWERQYGDE